MIERRRTVNTYLKYNTVIAGLQKEWISTTTWGYFEVVFISHVHVMFEIVGKSFIQFTSAKVGLSP